MKDPITDMLNRIKNAQAVGKSTVSLPYSELKNEIAKVMGKKGFIEKIEKKGRKSKKTLEITLKYQDKVPAISGMKRVSRPGQRIYASCRRIKPVKGGYGISVISTSKGLMTNSQAKKQNLGGEIILEIW